MGHTFRKARSGEKLRIPAAAYNAFIELVQNQQARQRELQSEGSSAHRSSGIVLVKNASGADRARFDILGIDTPLFTPSASLDSFCNRIALRGVTPTADHAGRFVILAEPLKANAIGSAWCAGVCPVKVDVQNALHTAADIIPNSAASLRSGFDGSAFLLWKEAGTGTKWAIVRLGQALPAVSFWAKITAYNSITGSINNRYWYSWIEQQRTASGFADKPAGRTGVYNALNSLEANNTSSGIQGNSVHHSASYYPPGFSLQPVRGNPVVRMWMEIAADGTVAYSFEYANAEEGNCA